MKKRLTVVLATFLFVTALYPMVSALQKPVKVPELNLEISAPNNWHVFTRQTEADDPVFSIWEGIDKEYMDQLFEQGSIYYNAVENETASQEIVVTMIPNENTFDWNGLSDEAYEAFAEELMNADMASITGVEGVSYANYEMVGHPQCRLMKLEGRVINSTEQTAVIQYVTVINGQHINVTLRSYTGTVSNTDEKMFDEILQDMRFTKVEERPSAGLAGNFAVYLGIGAFALVAVAAVVIVLVVVLGKRKKRRALEERQTLFEQSNSFAMTQAPPFTPEQPLNLETEQQRSGSDANGEE